MWSYPVSEIDGLGGERGVGELVLSDPKIVCPISEWATLTATITPEQAVSLTPWKSVIYMVFDEHVIAACLVSDLTEQGPEVQITAVGWPGVLKDMPWTAAERRLYVYNTGDAFREIWAHVQGAPRGNLGLTLTPFTTLATIGRGSAGGTVDEPFVLSPVETHDLSESIAACVDDGIEFREVHGFGLHVLECGTESNPIGSDLTALRLEVGLNITSAVEVEMTPDDAPTGVLLTGGADNPYWGVAYDAAATGVRRVVSITDVNTSSDADAASRAATRLAKYKTRARSYTATVVDSPSARLWAFRPGDTVAVHGTHWGGEDFAAVGRISSISYEPASGSADFDIVPRSISWLRPFPDPPSGPRRGRRRRSAGS